MYGIILNSGIGSRLGDLTENRPKGLVEVKQGVSLLSRQIDFLLACEVTKIIITTGYLEDQIQLYVERKFPSVDITLVSNELYRSTNYIVSLDQLSHIPFDARVILMHGDLVFSQDILREIKDLEGSRVIVDSLAPIPQKDFKARLNEDGSVCEIGVNVFGKDCVACQPLYKMEPEFWRAWQQRIREFCLAGDTKVYAENALNTMLEEHLLLPFDVAGRLCMEIDTLDDLEKAKSLLALEKEGN